MGADKHDPKAIGTATLIKRTKEITFCSLHHHTTFSYLDGYGTPEGHIERAATLGMPAMALTEHGNVSSHVRLEQAAIAANVKPIFGCELYTGGIGEAATQRKNHLTVLAENQEGYRNLLRLVSRGWSEGFYYEPTVAGSMLSEHKEGVVVLSGCSGSLLATSLVGGKNVAPEDASMERGRHVAERFKDALGDSFYLEVQAFPELDKTCNVNKALGELSEKLGIPLVATLDVHYTQPEESELQAILHNVRGQHRKSLEDLAKAWSYDVKLCPIGDDALLKRLVHTGLSVKQAAQAIMNTKEIAQRCNVTLPKVDNLQFPLAGTGFDDPVALFRRWVNDGWKYRRFPSLPPQERQRYIERCKYEMTLIESKGFVDYFLVVSDAVRFAKDSGIPVGPARGSAAASLVCYLLRITEVEPMLFPTLMFERFIDVNRHDLPDIDLDFDDEERWRVRDYLVRKYGADRVGNIGTFTKYKGKNSLEDVQRSLYPENWEAKAAVDEIKGLLLERSSGDLRASATIEDTIEMFPQVKAAFDRFPGLYKATLLEGNIRGMSVHAAGLVVANAPLTDFCAVYARQGIDGSVVEVVSLDKFDAEYLNILKIDALGLKTMGMIRLCLEQIGMSLEELYAIGLDDRSTIDGFREGDVVGIFQFDGRAMRSVNQGVIPDNFMEVCDINALARPGPLHSGATGDYIDAKHGRKASFHYHPIVDRVTEHTQFQVVYQEQILQIVRELGGFSWEEAARIRKIISKKRGEQEFNQQRDKFVQGAKKHGMDKADANKVFSMLATAGAYAFNAAHCVSYGMLAYWTMWLKRNHPTAFYVASLRKTGGGDKKGREKQSQLLRDCAKKGIPVKSLHLNKCGTNWTMDGDSIRPGFTQISGIGEKTANVILAKREELGRFSDWSDVAKARGVGPIAIEKMQEFIEQEDPFQLTLLQETLDKVRKELINGMPDQPGSPFSLPRPTHTAAEVPYEKTERDVGVVWLGIIRDRNLKDLFEMHHSKTGEILDPGTVRDPHLNEWVVMTGEDDTDMMVVTIDRWRYRKFREQVWDIRVGQDLVLVRGLKKHFQARRAIYVTDLWVIDPEDDEPEPNLEDQL
jgi:DNA polymerase III subunit alpha